MSRFRGDHSGSTSDANICTHQAGLFGPLFDPTWSSHLARNPPCKPYDTNREEPSAKPDSLCRIRFGSHTPKCKGHWHKSNECQDDAPSIKRDGLESWMQVTRTTSPRTHSTKWEDWNEDNMEYSPVAIKEGNSITLAVNAVILAISDLLWGQFIYTK
jgi:hypothetical protein